MFINKKRRKEPEKRELLKIRKSLLFLVGLYSIIFIGITAIVCFINLRNIIIHNVVLDEKKLSDTMSLVLDSDDNLDGSFLISKIEESELRDLGDVHLVDGEGTEIYKLLKEGIDIDISSINPNIREGILDFGEYKVFIRKDGERDLMLAVVIENEYFSRNIYQYLKIYGVSSLTAVIIFLITMLIFRKKVYTPIVTVEKFVHELAAGGTDLEISRVREGDALSPLYGDLNIMLSKLEDLVLKEATAKLMKKQAELEALQSQINPHFLYNTLESIRGQAIINGLSDIETMVQALSNLFRYSISNKDNLISLSEEFKNTENYLMIQQYRFNNKFLIINKFDKDTLNCKVPKFLIQPIVENAIHHGLETKIGKGTISFKSYITEKRLIINIRDDGLGIEHEKLKAINKALVSEKNEDLINKAGIHIGLVNTNERIKLIFGNDYGLRIYSTMEVGTNVEIVLPINF